MARLPTIPEIKIFFKLYIPLLGVFALFYFFHPSFSVDDFFAFALFGAAFLMIGVRIVFSVRGLFR